MLAENGLRVGSDAVRDVLENADVLTIGFTLFPERLLIDTRASASEGPLVAIVAPVATVQERYLWLGKHRGNFGAPRAFSFFVWPHTVRHLIEEDVLRPVKARLAAVSSESDEAVDRALQKLLRLERQAMASAIVGVDGWQTIWERTRTPR